MGWRGAKAGDGACGEGGGLGEDRWPGDAKGGGGNPGLSLLGGSKEAAGGVIFAANDGDSLGVSSLSRSASVALLSETLRIIDDLGNKQNQFSETECPIDDLD
jgi:hypothetical protein